MRCCYRRIVYSDKIYYLSLWKIWQKIHIDNNYTEENEFLWKVSSSFKTVFRLCFICYGALLILLYAFVFIDFTVEPSGNLVLIAFNIMTVFIPIIILDTILTLFVPLTAKPRGELSS